MVAVRRGRPQRKLVKHVPKQGSTSPFAKDRRHAGVSRVMLAGASSGTASRQIAALQARMYHDDGTIDTRVMSSRSIRRFVRDFALQGKIAANSSPGRGLRLDLEEEFLALAWVDAVGFFAQV
jgi:hypothetical protein